MHTLYFFISLFINAIYVYFYIYIYVQELVQSSTAFVFVVVNICRVCPQYINTKSADLQVALSDAKAFTCKLCEYIFVLAVSSCRRTRVCGCPKLIIVAIVAMGTNK